MSVGGIGSIGLILAKDSHLMTETVPLDVSRVLRLLECRTAAWVKALRAALFALEFRSFKVQVRKGCSWMGITLDPKTRDLGFNLPCTQKNTQTLRILNGIWVVL